MTLNDSTKTALMEAAEANIPFIASFIEDGMATVYSSGTKMSEVLDAVAHCVLQITLNNSEEGLPEEDYAEMLLYTLDYVQEHALCLLKQLLSFSDTAN